MEQYEEQQHHQLFPSSFVDSSLLPANGAAQGERPRARRRRRRAARCGGEADAGDPKKQRLSDEQVEMLELSFREERKLETGRKVHLASELGLDPKQVAVWFQNRRARHKSKLLEEEFAKLKQAHDADILHKCQLENELMRMKERLAVAEEELTRLRSSAGSHIAVSGDAMGGRVVCSGSPTSSFSTGTCHQQQPGISGGGVDHLGDDVDLIYVPDVADYVYADNGLVEWFSLYGLM
ncbi:hypothetical protein PR202_gb21437 [Eleusine coracana subsp. coracana]|uniref:Homeobox-leucine zipper protein n=1 Tax=Eleusine coracana subsp. coracana TaxID=191504 RepID=A0AAV5FF76_ELECO|nr:hypothetical protein QOZ80_7BG0605990 [Eleusine coracana subsp. coracana]GJN32895.1 hypothetical protein PR202_gb21437 [Eleusine coracana subsp. coracana]